MNTKLILIALISAGLSSCSTAYKMQQTPDDVYYSPTPQRDEYVKITNEEDKNVYRNEERNTYSNSNWEDREIIRRVNNRRWRKRYNDYGYNYPYPYGYYPYEYNPYGYNTYPVYVDPKTGIAPSTYKGARKYNLGTYTKPPVTTYTVDAKTGKIINAAPVRTTVKPQINPGSGVGNVLRRVFSAPANNSGNNTTPNNSAQSRSFESPRSSSSSSSPAPSTQSSSSSNAPVRSFKKN